MEGAPSHTPVWGQARQAQSSGLSGDAGGVALENVSGQPGQVRGGGELGGQEGIPEGPSRCSGQGCLPPWSAQCLRAKGLQARVL